MVRPADYLRTANPIYLVAQFARHYTHGRKKQYDHLFFYCMDKRVAERLLVFGGKVYHVRYKGWVWFCSKRKELLAIERLIEGEDLIELSDDMKRFKKRMHRRILRMHGK